MKYSYCFVDKYNLESLLYKKTEYWVLDVTDFSSEKVNILKQKLESKKIKYGIISNKTLTPQMIDIIKPSNIFIQSEEGCSFEIIIECIKNNCVPLFLDNVLYNQYCNYCKNSTYIGTKEDLLHNSNEIITEVNEINILDDKNFLRKEVIENNFFWGIGEEMVTTFSKDNCLWYNLYNICVDFLKRKETPDFFYLFPIKDVFIVEREICKHNPDVIKKEDGKFHIYFRQEERDDSAILSPRLLPSDGLLILSKVRDTNPHCFLSEAGLIEYTQNIIYKISGNLAENINSHNGHDLFYKDKKFYSSETFRDTFTLGGTMMFTIIYMDFEKVAPTFYQYCKDSKNQYCGMQEFLPEINNRGIINYIISDLENRC